METVASHFASSDKESRASHYGSNHGLAQLSDELGTQPQFVRLEESFDEVKRAGGSVQEEVKVAVLLK